MVGQTIDTTMLARLLDSREWTKKEAKTSENTPRIPRNLVAVQSLRDLALWPTQAVG
jgi:hypothetical protein